MTNPQEIVPEHILMEQLCSDGILKVRRKDIVNRWKDGCALGDLLRQKDPRWASFNVIGKLTCSLCRQYTCVECLEV